MLSWYVQNYVVIWLNIREYMDKRILSEFEIRSKWHQSDGNLLYVSIITTPSHMFRKNQSLVVSTWPETVLELDNWISMSSIMFISWVKTLAFQWLIISKTKHENWRKDFFGCTETNPGWRHESAWRLGPSPPEIRRMRTETNAQYINDLFPVPHPPTTTCHENWF